jgi:hypothetical protein
MIVHYSEERKVWWNWILIVTALVCISALVAVFLKSEVRATPAAFITYVAAGGTAVLLAFLVFIFSRYEVRIAETYIQFGYNGWHKRVEHDEVVGVANVDARFWTFGGLGWRIDTRGRIGYIVNFGPAVEVTLKTGRIYVFSCLEPDKVVRLLERDIASSSCNDG